MTVHKLIPMKVAGETVFLTRLGATLFVPARPLLETILGMNWNSSKKRLDDLAGPLKVRTLTVEYASGKAVTQPCITAGKLDGYLWGLRPGTPEGRAKIAALREHWPDAFATFLGADAELGAPFVALAEKAMSERLRADDAERRAEEAAALPKNPVFKKLDKVLGVEEFMSMHRMFLQGMAKSEIAREVGCNRTTVSLFLSGAYSTPAAISARKRIAAEAPRKK